MGRTKKLYNTPKVILICDELDLERILMHLKNGDEVIVNVSNVELKFRYRYIDFISGYVMALNGKRCKLEENIYSFKISI